VPQPAPIHIVHDLYGGAYGKPIAPAEDAAARCLSRTGIVVDATYSAKALAAAIGVAERDGGTTLFWLTFDGRWLRRSVALR
jgi:1-aminocyclopropane-1-carboxylate deaminase/D-cysteine desulfhydrase-like pyridoxal-dependent ACC family enzyme